MRNMLSARLCHVCSEALFTNLLLSDAARLSRISLIHAVRITYARDISSPSYLADASSPPAERAAAGSPSPSIVVSVVVPGFSRWRPRSSRGWGQSQHETISGHLEILRGNVSESYAYASLAAATGDGEGDARGRGGEHATPTLGENN